MSWLLPLSVHEIVPPGHVAHCVHDTVREAVDLSANFQACRPSVRVKVVAA
jgi:hypothetical protein